MAAPNIAALTTMTGKTDAVSLTTTSRTSVLSNAASSGLVLRVTSLRVSNVDGSASSSITVSYNNQAAGAGTEFELVQLKSVAQNEYAEIVTKDSPIYLEEDTSLTATASGANDFKVVVTYEEIS